MPPEFDNSRNVRTWCDHCASITTFEKSTGGSKFGQIDPAYEDGIGFVGFRLYRCSRCGRGGLGELAHNSHNDLDGMDLQRFYPTCFARTPLPGETPEGIRCEVEEAAVCADAGAFRGGSALLRSALEKTLVANGYAKGGLVLKIDEAATDGVISHARKQRAHSHVRALGNDVVHDEWRPVDAAEFELAYQYVQRLIEDLYENREEVISVLADKGRLAVTSLVTTGEAEQAQGRDTPAET